MDKQNMSSPEPHHSLVSLCRTPERKDRHLGRYNRHRCWIQMLWVVNLRTLQHASLRTGRILRLFVVKIHQVHYRLSCRLFAVLHADFQPVLLPCRLPWQFVPSFTALQMCAKYACWYKTKPDPEHKKQIKPRWMSNMMENDQKGSRHQVDIKCTFSPLKKRAWESETKIRLIFLQ